MYLLAAVFWQILQKFFIRYPGPLKGMVQPLRLSQTKVKLFEKNIFLVIEIVIPQCHLV